MTISIRYLCRCMKEEVTVEVAPRIESEDVIAWMHNVMSPRIAADHLARSPLCRQRTMTYVKIPFDDDTPVGSEKKL